MTVNIKHLAQLANLNLSEKEEKNLEKSIPAVVEYMDEIKNLDVDTVAETFRVTEEVNVFREDIVEESFSQEEALQNAKKSHNGFFVVPYVFDSAAKSGE